MTRLAALLLSLAATQVFAGHEFEGRDLAAGSQLYADNCAVCHGANLEGQPDWQTPDADGVYPAPPHDASGHTWHHSNAQLFAYTKLGGQRVVKDMGLRNFTSGMPAFEDVLSDDEIWSILAFIAASWPAREAEVQASRNPPH